MSPKRRAKGDGTLFQRRDGYWAGGVELPTSDGRRRWKRIVRKDYAEAVKALRKLRSEVDAGRIPTTSNTTVARWLDHWLTSIHGPTVKPTTLRSYELSVRRHINPLIGSKRLDRLTPEDVRGMHRALQDRGSTRNAQKAHQVLQRALKDAVNEGVIGRNVAAATAKPKHVKERRTGFSAEVSRHIITTAIASRDETWATRWAAGFYTGAREGEVLGLTWDRVNLTDGVIDLAWQIQELQMTHGCGDKTGTGFPCGRVRPSACPKSFWKFPPGFEAVPCEGTMVWTRPKSQAGTRTVPLAAPLHAMLQLLKSHDTGNPHQLVFHEQGKPITPSHDRQHWKQLLDAAGVPYQPLHTMRNSAATLLMEAGIDGHIIQAIVGHSDILTTRGYQTAGLPMKRQAIDALGQLLAAKG